MQDLGRCPSESQPVPRPLVRALPHGGRLKHFLPVWRTLTSDSVILDIIKGYMLPFKRTPPVQTSSPWTRAMSPEEDLALDL